MALEYHLLLNMVEYLALEAQRPERRDKEVDGNVSGLAGGTIYHDPIRSISCAF
jgi:hypothetical protein